MESCDPQSACSGGPGKLLSICGNGKCLCDLGYFRCVFLLSFFLTFPLDFEVLHDQSPWEICCSEVLSHHSIIPDQIAGNRDPHLQLCSKAKGVILFCQSCSSSWVLGQGSSPQVSKGYLQAVARC